jgi:hypothetical protein
MNTNAKISFLIILLFLFLGSCTYATRQQSDWSSWGSWEQTGSRQSHSIRISSRPEGATIIVDGNAVGETPAMVNLAIPVLKAQRIKSEYERRVPGVLEHFLLNQQTTTSTVTSQREERYATGTRNCNIEIRKEGYQPKRITITVPETTTVDVSLKERPVFEFKGFSVRNKFRLTTLERVYEFFLDKRFSPDTSKFNSLKGMAVNSEAFKNPLGKEPEYFVKGEIDIQRDNTEVTVTLTDRTGRILTERRVSVETKNPEGLALKIEAMMKSITDRFIQ